LDFVRTANNARGDAAIKGVNGTDPEGFIIMVDQPQPSADRPSGRRF
jgi:hypothetical protein